MIYVVVYVWDYEFTRNVLVTMDKVKAEQTAKNLNEKFAAEGISSTYHAYVEDMELDRLYEV